MSQELASKIEEAIKDTKEWYTRGWNVTFGPRRTIISNLEEAKGQPDTFVYKLEAIAYWNRVKNASEDALDYGEKALASLKSGDMRSVEDYIYAAYMAERPMTEKKMTWEELYHQVQAMNGNRAA